MKIKSVTISTSRFRVPGKWKTGNWAKYSEEMPLWWLIQFREYDRAATKDGRDRIEQIKESIKERGLDEPLILTFGLNGKAFLSEGNHRLVALHELGYYTAPVRAHRYQNVQHGAAFNTSKLEALRAKGHVPEDIEPSAVFIVE